MMNTTLFSVIIVCLLCIKIVSSTEIECSPTPKMAKTCKYIQSLEKRVADFEALTEQLVQKMDVMFPEQIQELKNLINDTQRNESKDYVKVPRKKRIAGRYLGCYQDNIKDRMFRGYAKRTNINTNESCVNLCRQGGFIYAGTGGGAWCTCGNTQPQLVAHPKLPDEKCNYDCTGNPKEKCGGAYINSVYETGNQQYILNSDDQDIGESYLQASPYRYYEYKEASATLDP